MNPVYDANVLRILVSMVDGYRSIEDRGLLLYQYNSVILFDPAVLLFFHRTALLMFAVHHTMLATLTCLASLSISFYIT